MMDSGDDDSMTGQRAMTRKVMVTMAMMVTSLASRTNCFTIVSKQKKKYSVALYSS